VVEEQFRLDWAIVPMLAIAGVVAAGVGYWYYNSRKPPAHEEELAPPPGAKTQEYSYGGALDSVPSKGNPPKPPQVPE
jgi:hypothetical protein